MSSVNQVFSNGGKFGLAAGAACVIFAQILGHFDSAWNWVFGAVGIFLIAMGGVSSAFEGIPRFLGMASRHT